MRKPAKKMYESTWAMGPRATLEWMNRQEQEEANDTDCLLMAEEAGNMAEEGVPAWLKGRVRWGT